MSLFHLDGRIAFPMNRFSSHPRDCIKIDHYPLLDVPLSDRLLKSEKKEDKKLNFFQPQGPVLLNPFSNSS